VFGLKHYFLFQSESEVAAYMRKMLIAIGLPKPPDNITAFQLFSKLEAKVSDINILHEGAITGLVNKRNRMLVDLIHVWIFQL
jgi:hypothetical protein